MKKFLIFFGFIIFLLLILIGNQSIDIPKTKTKILEYVPREILILFKTLNNGAFLKNYDYAYNVVYGPETQFLDLTLDKKKLNFVDKKWFYPFYFDFYQDSMVIVDSSGNIIIKPKCGIELLNRNSSVLKGTHKNLYKYLTENLGLVCSKTLDWNKMVKLLRTV